MKRFGNILILGILPIVAFYGAYIIFGFFAFVILLIYFIGILFYLLEWVNAEDDIDRLFPYLYIFPLSVMSIIYGYFEIENGLLYICIFLLYLVIENHIYIFNIGAIVDEKRINVKVKDELNILNEKYTELEQFITRLSNASGYDINRINEIEKIRREVEMENKIFNMVGNSDSKESNINNMESEKNKQVSQYHYEIDKDDSWEEIIWKWADAYRINEDIIPRDKAKLINIKKLELSPFSLADTPSIFNKTGNITLPDSNIDKIPNEICHLINLETLDLSHTKINTIPKEISNLKNLEYLILVETNIKYLPEEISQLKKLKFIKIKNSRKEVLSNKLEDIITFNIINE